MILSDSITLAETILFPAQLSSLKLAKLNAFGEVISFNTENEARADLSLNNGVILGASNLSPELLRYYNYRPCELDITEDPGISPKAPKTYVIRNFVLEEEYIRLYLRQTVSNSCKVRYWQQLRDERNAALADTDWVMSCEDVTPACKKRFKAYRQALRRLPAIASEAYDITVPSPPPIVMKKVKSEQLSDEQILALQSHSPKVRELDEWNTFITAWQQSGTNEISYVGNLMEAYTGKDIDSLL